MARRWVDGRRPRTRLWIARAMAASGLDRTAIRRLADAFCAEGVYAGAGFCWRRMRQWAPGDEAVLLAYVQCALDAGDGAEAWRVFRESADGMGLPPARVIWLAGELVCRDRPVQAAEVLLGVDGKGEVLAEALARAPSMLSPPTKGTEGINSQRAGLRPRVSDVAAGLTGSTPAAAEVELARWCYGGSEMDAAARLYDKAAADHELCWLDEIAARRAEARCGRLSAGACSAARLRRLVHEARDCPDALVALAEVAAGLDARDVAFDAVRAAVTHQYAGSESLDALVDDALAILDSLGKLRGRALDGAVYRLDPGKVIADPMPKRFVCGFGWTGSGAIYDAVRSDPGFCEFEGAGEDALLNEDSDTEATFIQSHAGLGWLWARWRVGEPVHWQMLWDLFRCHVIGLGAVGYSEYKAAAAAHHHVRIYQTAYTGIFRRVFADLEQAFASPRRGAVHEALLRATEALCRMLGARTGGRRVLFNNAVFGRDPVMLEIFAGYRAAIVYRDPRDVYVDRLRHDKNHWRTPEQMTAYYRHGLETYLAYKSGASKASADRLREISFERFVGDATFRDKVMHWLLDGRELDGRMEHFDPAVSRGNIGIFHGALGERDQAHMEGALGAHRRMERRAGRSWNTRHGAPSLL